MAQAQKLLTKTFTSANNPIRFNADQGFTVISIKATTGSTATLLGTGSYFGSPSDAIDITDSSPVNVGSELGFQSVEVNVTSGTIQVIAY